MPAARWLFPFAMMCTVSPVQGDIVERRGGADYVEGRITAIDDSGLKIVAQSGADFLIPWDSVRRVTMDRPDVRLREFLTTAENLWRGRSRVQRGDMALAEPLFARLFEQFRGQTHETALIVSEGFLRTLLFRGANEAAIIPALEVARLRRAGIATDRYASLEPVLDEESYLCPQLAPAWTRSRLLDAVERDLTEYDPQGDEVVGEMAALYLQAIRRQQASAPLPPADAAGSSVAGVPLLRLFVALRSVEKEQREDARRSLERLMPEFEGWREGWVRFALGSSLLMESGVGRQQRGMVELLHLPARFHQTLPYLSGLALAAVADAAAGQDDEAMVSTMEAELARLYPNHPARAATTAAENTKDSS